MIRHILKHRFYSKRITVLNYTLLILFFLASINNGVSQDSTKYKDISKENLLEKSWKSFSFEEKKIIRSHLKNNYPKSTEGLFSAAYIANENDKIEKSISLYKKALKKSPEHLFTLSNLSNIVQYQESKKLIDRIISIDSSFSNYLGLRRKFNILYENSDSLKTKQFLKEISKKLPNHFLPHYLLGRYNTLEGNYRIAKDNFEHALKLDSTNFEIIRSYINLGINKLTNSQTPTEDRTKYFESIGISLKKTDITKVERAEQLYFFAEKLLDLDIKPIAFNFYKASFDSYPTAESILGALKCRSGTNGTNLDYLLNSAKSKLPNNRLVERLLANWNITYHSNPQKSKLYFQNSISNSKTLNDSLEGYLQMALIYYHYGEDDYLKAKQAIDNFKNSNKDLSIDHEYRILMDLHKVAFQNMDFKTALKHLEDANRLDKLKKSYYLSRRNEIENIIGTINSENTNKPQLVATTVLKTDNSFAVSPDNKFAVIGQSPLQLWNFKDKYKIKDLGRGRTDSKFSPDGKYLATISNYKLSGEWSSSSIFIYDIPSGSVAHVISGPNQIELHRLDWNPESNRIVYSTEDGYIFVYDLNLKRRIAIGRSGKSQISSLLLWHKSGKFIISGQAQAKQLKIHNADNLTEIRVLNDVDWPHALAQTYDGRFLICSDNRGYLTTWDIENDWIKYDQTYIRQSAKNISSHPFKPIVVINSFSRNNIEPLITYDIQKKLKIKETYSRLSRPKIAFSVNGDYIFKAEDNEIDILSSDNLEQIDSVIGESSYAYSSKIDRKNDYYLTMDDEGVKVWNILNGRKVYTWLNKPNYFYKIHGEDGDKYLAAFEDNELKKTYVYQYNTSNLSKSLVQELDFRLNKIVESENKLIFAGYHFKDLNGNINYGEIAITKKSNFSIDTRISNINLVEDILKYEKGEVPRAGFIDIDISHDGRRLIYATYWQDGFGHGISYSKNCRVLDLEKEGIAEIRVIKSDYGIKRLAFYGENDSFIRISNGTEYRLYNSSTFNFEKYGTDGIGLSVKALKNGDTLSYNSEAIIYKKNGKELKIRYPHSNLNDVEIFEDKNLLVSLTNLNEIEFYDLDGFSKKLTIISKNKGEYVSFTPEGQYIASKNGGNKVFWVTDNRTLEMNTLSNENSNEGLIKGQLEAIFSKKAFLLPSSISTNEIPPETKFTIKNKSSLYEKPNYIFEFEVFKSEPGSEEPRIELELNGSKIDDKFIEKQIFNDTIYYKVNIRFRERNNLVQVFQIFKDLKILRLKRNFFPNSDIEEISELPRLLIYGIGISKYKDTTKTLNYPDKDIRDIVNTFNKQKGLRYSDVIIHDTILDSDATRKNIELNLDLLDGIVNDEDIVLIYYSGHGEIVRQELCLMPYDINFERKTSRYRVGNLIRYAQARRSENAHTILMFDMCNSGTIKKELFKTYLNYSENGGISVFASTTDVKSFEESKYGKNGNGAFTAAMISGINGDADKLYVGDNNNEVNLYELSIFLKEKVKELTNVQIPEFIPVGNTENFIISKKRK